jgi:hypothetical protein
MMIASPWGPKFNLARSSSSSDFTAIDGFASPNASQTSFATNHGAPSRSEIDENLVRSQLTPAQEASAIFRRKAIYEELHPETKATYAGGSFKGNQHGAVTDNLSATNFASATADATGKDERTVRRAAARGEALGDDLGAVTGTSLDKGVELDEISRSFALNPNLDRSCNRRKFGGEL